MLVHVISVAIAMNRSTIGTRLLIVTPHLRSQVVECPGGFGLEPVGHCTRINAKLSAHLHVRCHVTEIEQRLAGGKACATGRRRSGPVQE